MTDYRQMFEERVVQGLGLGSGQITTDPKKANQAYREDPAEAFTRAAAAQIPGDSIPIPFATLVPNTTAQ